MTREKINTNDLFHLKDRVAIITGGGGLLGEQHAIALSDFGCNLVLVDRDFEKCRQLGERLESEKQIRAIALQGDVTSKDSWAEILRKALTINGKVDILVNNAAFTTQSRSANYDADFEDFPLEDWQQILNVNLSGSFLGCQIIGKQMLKQGKGSIINMASLYGVVSPNHRMYPGTGIHQPPAYSVSKAGVIALTRYVASLWGDKGVRVNCITPGGVYNEHPELFNKRYSNLSPMNRMAKKEEMRGALIYLASDASAYCTGHNLAVDGGWTAW